MSGAFASPSKSANDLASIAGSIGDNGTTADKSKSSPAPENQDGWNQSLGDSVPTVVTTAVSKMMPTRMAPWGEFLSRSALKLPQISEIPGRLRENRKFGGNYAVSTGVLLSLWVITHPMTLFVVVALAGTWTYALRRKDPVVVGGTELTERQLYLALCGITFLVVMGTSVAETLTTALCTALLLCLVHAVMHASEEEVQYTGLPTTVQDLELGSMDTGLELNDITSLMNKVQSEERADAGSKPQSLL